MTDNPSAADAALEQQHNDPEFSPAALRCLAPDSIPAIEAAEWRADGEFFEGGNR